jgi:hypothetical protein
MPDLPQHSESANENISIIDFQHSAPIIKFCLPIFGLVPSTRLCRLTPLAHETLFIKLNFDSSSVIYPLSTISVKQGPARYHGRV